MSFFQYPTKAAETLRQLLQLIMIRNVNNSSLVSRPRISVNYVSGFLVFRTIDDKNACKKH